jgi:hypothetical protein
VIEADRGRREDDPGPAPPTGDSPVAQRPGELPRGGRPASLAAQLAERIAIPPEILPGLVAVAVFVFWATAQGGVSPTDSYPGELLLLGLLVVTVYAFRAELYRLPRLQLAALALLAGFALWNFASIGWADDQGAAWDGANRVLLYLIVFAIFVLPPWRPRPAAVLLGVYALAVALVGGIVLLKAAGSAHPLEQYFIAGRFAEPLGYHNANSALFTMGMFIAIFLSARRETPWPMRGLMLAAAGVLFQLALMPQSRGWLIAAPVAFIAYLIVIPGLARSLASLIPLAIVAALTAGPVLDVYDTVNNGGDLISTMDDARTAMLVAAAVLFVAGGLIGIADQRIELSEQSAQIGNRVVLGVVGLGALIGVVVALVAIGNPATWASDRWHEFKSGEFEHSLHQGSRLAQGLGSNRYDFWRVAADEFTAHPLAGVGSDNYAQDYVLHRHSLEEPTYPHNVPLQVVSTTGLIGGLLFGTFLVLALVGVGRSRLRGSPLARGVAGVTAVVFIYWLVHSIGDWFWAFPALTAPVFAWLAMCMRLDAERGPVARPGWARRLGVPLAGGSIAVAILAAVSMVLPWGAALDVKKASESWGANPRLAFQRLDEARDLNFLSAQPDLVTGAIASQLGYQRRMRSAFDRALERDPRNWYATLELAALDAIQGDSQSALQRLDRVAQLNPKEEMTAVVRQGVVSGHPLTLQAVDAAFVERYCQRLGRNPDPNGGCT